MKKPQVTLKEIFFLTEDVSFTQEEENDTLGECGDPEEMMDHDDYDMNDYDMGSSFEHDYDDFGGYHDMDYFPNHDMGHPMDAPLPSDAPMFPMMSGPEMVMLTPGSSMMDDGGKSSTSKFGAPGGPNFDNPPSIESGRNKDGILFDRDDFHNEGIEIEVQEEGNYYGTGGPSKEGSVMLDEEPVKKPEFHKPEEKSPMELAYGDYLAGDESEEENDSKYERNMSDMKPASFYEESMKEWE